MNDSGDGVSLASLIERSAELKGALVDFACGPRFERHLARFMLEAAGPEGELSEGEAIAVIDRFALQHRMPNGKTVLDQFLASRAGLTPADREMLRGWGDPVEGIFEILGKDPDAIMLLNLIDDLEYRTYSNMGRTAFRRLSKGGFVHARLVPVRPMPGVWLVSGTLAGYPKSSAAQIAQAALELMTRQPGLVCRNPERIEQGWTQMREDRAAFMEFFGGDELVLAPAEPTNGSTPTTATVRKPRTPRTPGAAGHDTSPAWTSPPSTCQPNSPTPTPSASSKARPTGSTSTTSTGCCATSSPTRPWRPTSDTRRCCAGTWGRTASARCPSGGWPPPSRKPPTRCS
jgi:hypothetical protein